MLKLRRRWAIMESVRSCTRDIPCQSIRHLIVRVPRRRDLLHVPELIYLTSKAATTKQLIIHLMCCVGTYWRDVVDGGVLSAIVYALSVRAQFLVVLDCAR